MPHIVKVLFPKMSHENMGDNKYIFENLKFVEMLNKYKILLNEVSLKKNFPIFAST